MTTTLPDATALGRPSSRRCSTHALSLCLGACPWVCVLQGLATSLVGLNWRPPTSASLLVQAAHQTVLPCRTYCIGKERLFLEIAHRLGRKVYVSKDKLSVLECVNLSPSYRALLTNDHLETNLHAVSA